MTPSNGGSGFRGMVQTSEPPAVTKEKLLRAQEMMKSGASFLEITSKICQPLVEDILETWITSNDKMLRIKNRIRAIKHHNTSSPVLITGPTGTGKELLARALQIPNEPFIAVNCGGLPRDLVPSLFFGHKKGAFTGATENRDGILYSAKSGIVFLDEIAELPLELQATLLRAIQESEIYPVGEVTPIKIKCRFVAATKHNLREMVNTGKFREDLFARLYTHELRVTGLQERPDDIPLIAASLGWSQPIPEKVMPDIHQFNVRAIQTYVERMKIYGEYEY